MRTLSLTALATALALLAPGGARAANVNYTFKPLAQIGGMAGDVPIPTGYTWFLGPLNDDGQILVDAGTVLGGKPEILLQYTDGKFTPLVAAGLDGPLGPWPKLVGIVAPLNLGMNGRGDSVFRVVNNSSLVGTFYREAQSGKMTAVALPGMPATGDLTFINSFSGSAAINNRGEIALLGYVKGTASPTALGLFFRAGDGSLQPIFLPGQTLPDGNKGQLTSSAVPAINDAGIVAFVVGPSAYQWEKGNLTPLVTAGTDVPGIGKIATVDSVRLNNRNGSALVRATVAAKAGRGLYRAAGGTLTAVAVPGQAMPSGGTLKTIADPHGGDSDISAATEASQFAFLATLDDTTPAVYRVEADGSLALVLKVGMATPLGTVTRFGEFLSPATNSQGQVVLSAKFDHGPDTLVLLTPTPP